MTTTTTYTNWSYPIEVSLTTDSFAEKPANDAYAKLSYQTQTLSIEDFIYSISKQGRGFCAVMSKSTFGTSYKRRDNFLRTQVLCIDIDGTHLYESDVEVITAKNNLKPSLIQPSWTHKADSVTDRRYHLIYIFAQPLGKEDADFCANILHQELAKLLGDGVDKCSTDIAHLYNGSLYEEYITSQTKFLLADDKQIQIYSRAHFDTYKLDKTYKPRIAKVTAQTQPQTISAPQERVFEKREEQTISPSMLRDIADLLSKDNDMDWRKFTRTYSNCRLIYRTEPNRWEGMLHRIDPNTYVRLPYPRKRLKDGEQRYKWLHSRAVLRMAMYYDDIRLEELVYNYVYDVYRFCELEEDSKYTPDYILSACGSVWKLTKDYLLTNLDKYRTSKYNRVPKSGLITQRGLRTQTEVKALKLEVVRACFDDTMSYRDNLAKVNEVLADEYEDMGIQISNIVNYKEYLKELGLSNMETRQTTKAQQDDEMISKIMEVYDWSKSVRANHTDLKALGIAISRQRLNELVRSVQMDSCVA